MGNRRNEDLFRIGQKIRVKQHTSMAALCFPLAETEQRMRPIYHPL